MSADRSFYLVKKFYKGYHGEDDLFDEEATISFYGTSAEVSAFIVSKTSDEDRDRAARIDKEISENDADAEDWRKKKAIWLILSEDERKILGVDLTWADNKIRWANDRTAKLKSELERRTIRVGDVYWIEEEDRTFRNWSIVNGKIVINY